MRLKLLFSKCGWYYCELETGILFFGLQKNGIAGDIIFTQNQ